MTQFALLFSLKPKYANKIFSGEKTVELRRIKPKLLRENVLVLLYVSMPVQAIVGGFIVDSVIEAPLSKLWDKVRNRTGVKYDEFEEYFEGATVGFAVGFKQASLLEEPLSLVDIREIYKDFSPPQGFRYIALSKIKSLLPADLLSTNLDEISINNALYGANSHACTNPKN